MAAPSRRSFWITGLCVSVLAEGRYRALVPGRESALTRSGEPVRKKMTEAPEPEDTLDAATAPVGVVNGPEDTTFDWRRVDWRRVEDDVRRLRQRIFTASRAGDLARVRSLQKLMLRSRANTLLSVRRVTAQRRSSDGGRGREVVLTPEAKQSWLKGCNIRPSRSRRCRSGACTSRRGAATPSAVRSEFPGSEREEHRRRP